MKYALIVPDGMADRPVAELGGKTPLQVAKTPNMDRLSAEGRVGLARNCPPKMTPGTEVCMLALMSYDPREYFRGRGPLEALGRGIELRKSEVAFRCNLVTVQGDILEDYSAGHITDPEAKQIVEMLDKRLGSDEIRFHPGSSYRHIMVWRGGSEDVKTVAPHDIMGQPWKTHVPAGKGEARLLQMMEDSRILLMGHEVNRSRRMKKLKPANMIWLWSPGRTPEVPDFRTKFGIGGVVISAVDIVRGIGTLAGLEVVKVPGATGYFDTNYKGKGEAAAKALKKADLVVVHVEAPDEASHEGLVAEKIRAIEQIDEHVVGAILAAQPKLGDLAVLLLPDHVTPVEVRTHTDEPVPYVLWRSYRKVSGPPAFDEATAAAAAGADADDGWKLLDRFFRKPAPAGPQADPPPNPAGSAPAGPPAA